MAQSPKGFKEWTRDPNWNKPKNDWMSDIKNLRKNEVVDPIDELNDELNQTTERNEGGKGMSTNWMNAMKNKLVRQVEDVVIDLMSGDLGIVRNGTITTVKFPETGGFEVKNNPIGDMGLKIPGFAMRTDFANVNPGDIVHIAGASRLVVAKTDNGLKVVTGEGVVTEITTTNDLLLGNDGFMVVKNFLSGVNQNMLPMLLMMGDELGEDKLPMMMMMMGGLGGNAAAGGMNPMMLMMMMGMGKDGGKFDLKTMMLMQMMSGGNAGNMGNMMPWLMMNKLG